MAGLFKQGSERKSVSGPRNKVEVSNGVGNEQTRACHSYLAVLWSGNRIVLWLTTMRRRSATLGFGLVCGSALLLAWRSSLFFIGQFCWASFARWHCGMPATRT